MEPNGIFLGKGKDDLVIKISAILLYRHENISSMEDPCNSGEDDINMTYVVIPISIDTIKMKLYSLKSLVIY